MCRHVHHVYRPFTHSCSGHVRTLELKLITSTLRLMPLGRLQNTSFSILFNPLTQQLITSPVTRVGAMSSYVVIDEVNLTIFLQKCRPVLECCGNQRQHRSNIICNRYLSFTAKRKTSEYILVKRSFMSVSGVWTHTAPLTRPRVHRGPRL